MSLPVLYLYQSLILSGMVGHISMSGVLLLAWTFDDADD